MENMSEISKEDLQKYEEEYQKNNSKKNEDKKENPKKSEERRDNYDRRRYSDDDYDDDRYRHSRRYRDEDDDYRSSRRHKYENYDDEDRYRRDRRDGGDNRYEKSKRYDSYDRNRPREDRKTEFFEIFVGNLPNDSKESEVYDLFSKFGKVNKCHLVKDRDTGELKGFGFIKFYEKKHADEAIEKMNGSLFSGRILRVNEAGKKEEKTYNNIKLGREENIKISHSNRYILMQKLSRSGEENPSRCIVLKNMVDPDSIDNELQQEIKDECSKFGVVDQLIIYQQEVNGEIDVKVFILFNTVDGATKAQSKLHNRYFDQRKVHCEFYDEKAFLDRNFEE